MSAQPEFPPALEKKLAARLRAAAPAPLAPARAEAIVRGVMERIAAPAAPHRFTGRRLVLAGASFAAAAALALVLLVPGQRPATGPGDLSAAELGVLLENVQGFEQMETIKDMAFVLDGKEPL